MDCEFSELFEELCVRDCYRMREVPFIPDVVLDLGANVGVFTSYARFLFPRARIVAVEPDPRNWRFLKRYTAHLPSVVCIKAAIATGPVWHGAVPVVNEPYYATGESYVTLGQRGFPEKRMRFRPMKGETSDALPDYEPAPNVATVRFDTLVADHVPPEAKAVCKLDCEGGENCIFSDEPSMQALRRMDYIALETHFFCKGTGDDYQENKAFVLESLASLSATHDCRFHDGEVYFQAVRRNGP